MRTHSPDLRAYGFCVEFKSERVKYHCHLSVGQFWRKLFTRWRVVMMMIFDLVCVCVCAGAGGKAGGSATELAEQH